MPEAPTSPYQRPTLVGTEGLYLTGDDHLLITTLNANASAALTIGGRVLDERGRIVPFEQRIVPNTDRTAATALVRLPCGWLQNFTIRASSGSPIYGQTFVRADLVRGDNTGQTPLATLAQGLVTAHQRLGWPGTPLAATLERPGVLRSITGSDPAANAEWSETVPTGARWRLLSVLAIMVADANVANRNFRIIIDDGTNNLIRIGSNYNQTAGNTVGYTIGAFGFIGSLNFDPMPVPLPPNIVLLAGWRIRSETSARQVGDNWAAPQLLVEEWLEGN